MSFTSAQGVDLPNYKLKSVIAALVFLGLLTSCVTTTTGGFNVNSSTEQAVEDYVQLAVAYYDAGDMPGARRHANNAKTLNDRNSNVYNILALIAQREGDLGLADENFSRAIRLDRNNSRARNNYAALLFGMQKYKAAYEQLQVVSEDTGYEGRAIAFENLGRAAGRLNRDQEAETAFTRARQLNANLYISALELALLKFKRKDEVAARQSFQQYLTIVEFYKIPHTPRALLAGIQIESYFNNNKAVDDFAMILTTLFRESPEYQIYRSLSNAN